MSFRVTPEFKAKLDQIARKSGRSLAQEIEFRLERSLDEERHLADALELVFDQRTAGLMLAIGCVVKEADERRDWLSDPEAFRVVAQCIKIWLEALDPAGNPKTWARLRKALEVDTGKIPELSAAIVAAVLTETSPAYVDLGQWASTIRRWLGVSAIMRLKDRIIGSSPSPAK